MTTRESLYSLSARAYLDRAVRFAKARNWAKAKFDLKLYMSLQPSDHRAPLFMAKILLHEGQLQSCLLALDSARHLGHSKEVNALMVHRIQRQDQRRYARLVFRRQAKERCYTFACAIRRYTLLLISNVARGCTRLWDSISSWLKRKKPDDKVPTPKDPHAATAAGDKSTVDSSTDATMGESRGKAEMMPNPVIASPVGTTEVVVSPGLSPEDPTSDHAEGTHSRDAVVASGNIHESLLSSATDITSGVAQDIPEAAAPAADAQTPNSENTTQNEMPIQREPSRHLGSTPDGDAPQGGTPTS